MVYDTTFCGGGQGSLILSLLYKQKKCRYLFIPTKREQSGYAIEIAVTFVCVYLLRGNWDHINFLGCKVKRFFENKWIYFKPIHLFSTKTKRAIIYP